MAKMSDRERRYHAHKAYDKSGRREVKCRRCGATSYVEKPRNPFTRLRMKLKGDAGNCGVCGALRKR